MDDTTFGKRNKRGDWAPDGRIETAPVFRLPPRPLEFLKWLPHYFLPWNVIFAASALAYWYLVVPEAAIPKVGARVMDLQNPTAKMSKSADSPQGTLELLADPKQITKRIRSAVTDSETEVRYDPEHKPGVSNLLEILSATTDRSIPELEREFASGGYGPLKDAVAEAVGAFLAPVRERYEQISADPTHVASQLAIGAEKAEAISTKVVERARRAAGLLPRG